MGREGGGEEEVSLALVGLPRRLPCRLPYRLVGVPLFTPLGQPLVFLRSGCEVSSFLFKTSCCEVAEAVAADSLILPLFLLINDVD